MCVIGGDRGGAHRFLQGFKGIFTNRLPGSALAATGAAGKRHMDAMARVHVKIIPKALRPTNNIGLPKKQQYHQILEL